MNIEINPEDYRVKPGVFTDASKLPTSIGTIYRDKQHYKDLLDEYQQEIKGLQNMLYAHDRYALLLVFQGMDTAGKDSAIKHVMSGINPAGVSVHSFKRPTDQELDHDWMWRSTRCLPQRGRIGIFNRSYYEEVLVVKVHPEIVQQYQRIPKAFIGNLDRLWEERYSDIVNFEDFLHRNGTQVVKFFLHISPEEQKNRLIARIDRPDKNWKMELGDMKERAKFPDYMKVFSDCISKTSTENSPWYAIPGDDKKTARLIIAKTVLEHMSRFDMHYPKVTDEFRKKLKEVKAQLESGEI